MASETPASSATSFSAVSWLKSRRAMTVSTTLASRGVRCGLIMRILGPTDFGSVTSAIETIHRSYSPPPDGLLILLKREKPRTSRTRQPHISMNALPSGNRSTGHLCARSGICTVVYSITAGWQVCRNIDQIVASNSGQARKIEGINTRSWSFFDFTKLTKCCNVWSTTWRRHSVQPDTPRFATRLNSFGSKPDAYWPKGHGKPTPLQARRAGVQSGRAHRRRSQLSRPSRDRPARDRRGHPRSRPRP